MATENEATARSRLYQPLLTDRPEIRILVLEASSDYNAGIECRLETFCYFNMTQRTRNIRPYEALSYTWGGSARVRDIIVNGEIFPVTDNLECFLRERRELENDVDLWVDAICINQKDALEKNHQIPLMNMIYSFASKLIVWLGASTDDSHLAIRWLARLGEGSPYDKMPILQTAVIEAIQSLLDRPWWTRAWIVQELVAGGMGAKLGQLTVQCGKDSVPWTEIVISATRMKAHQEDRRQVFPNITNILELDSLRDSAGLFLLKRASLTTPYELLCRYRHFLASDPRDKIYAICDVFAKFPTQRLKPRYDISVEDTYTSFARQILLASEDLDFLRQCGERKLDIPSWVPDWSTPLEWEPLPVRISRRYFDVPWWAEPVVTDQSTPTNSDPGQQTSLIRYTLHPHPDDDVEAKRQQQMRLKRLEIVAHGFQELTTPEEIAQQLSKLNISSNEMENLRTLLDRKELMLFVEELHSTSPESNNLNRTQGNAVMQGELITERRMKQWLLKELEEPLFGSPYKSAATTRPEIKMSDSGKTMIVGGIEWDTVDTSHDRFVRDVDDDWKDATRFMVAVGCCKALTTAHPAVVTRYPTVEGLLEAFWLTIFAGQAEDDENETRSRLRYMEWLPNVPGAWTAATPQVTATTSGQVILAETKDALKEIYGNSPDKQHSRFAGYQFRSIIDDQDSCQQAAGRSGNEAEFEELAASWSQQPYDLYHRPFELSNTVPDPYWNIRKSEDTIARRNARENRTRPIISMLNAKDGEQESEDGDALTIRQLSNDISKILNESISMVPAGTLERGIEKYALGRKFFITSKGYLGLGPNDTMPGDKVAILFGSQVPFLLRKQESEPKESGWAVVGECYVQGIMNGEVIAQWEAGAVKSQEFHLQ